MKRVVLFSKTRFCGAFLMMRRVGDGRGALLKLMETTQFQLAKTACKTRAGATSTSARVQRREYEKYSSYRKILQAHASWFRVKELVKFGAPLAQLLHFASAEVVTYY